MDFIVFGTIAPTYVVLPLTCLSLAGITKAAQMPFHTWLLGAMVAPTPTSALLHSSTMVKAGVFMLIKCAPIYAVSFAPSILVILVGGITFLLCSMMAISQSNGKRVLAYSTVANLGLITACAGVGTAEAIWAAILLVIFHAVAKSLLFLCVGTAEHHIGSRDIEDMDLLFERIPHDDCWYHDYVPSSVWHVSCKMGNVGVFCGYKTICFAANACFWFCCNLYVLGKMAWKVSWNYRHSREY